jgi:hypothetical protein
MFKRLFLLFWLLYLGLACAQDFNLEYKTYLLQPFFKAQHIQTLTIRKSTDSTMRNGRIAYKLTFDSLGRVVKVYDYYFDTDTIPERLIEYGYGVETNYYESKKYRYFDSKQREALVKEWHLNFDEANHILTEKFYNQTEVYRTNSLVFNAATQLLSRTVKAYVISLRTKFTYDNNGLLRHVQLIKENPTVEKMKKLELNHYLQYNLNQKIMTSEQWVGQRQTQISEYYYNYIGRNISTKVGWSLMNWSSDDKKLIERTDFTYDRYGLLTKADYYNEKLVTPVHKYTSFSYTFFEGKGRITDKSDQFTMLWFTDIFAENLIHP